MKPWERNRGSSTTTAPGTGTKPWEQATGAEDPTAAAASSLSTVQQTRTQPARPWESGDASTSMVGSTSYLGANSGMASYGSGLYGNTTSAYGRPGMYGGSLGSTGGLYGSSMYGSGGMYGGSSMYGGGGGMYGARGMYGGSGMYSGTGMYGSGGMYGGGGMYGNSMYGSGGMGYGGAGGMYGAGMGPPMGPNGMPYDPSMGPPPAPPSAWQSLLAGINGIMMFFGRLSFLVDENAHAVHFFISALLQLLDRTGSLYAEIARFVLRVLFRRKAKTAVAVHPHVPGLPQAGSNAKVPGGGAPALLQGPSVASGATQAGQLQLAWPGSAPAQGPGQWDSVWGG